MVQAPKSLHTQVEFVKGPILNRCDDVFVFGIVRRVFISRGTNDFPAPQVDVVRFVKVLKRRQETFNVGISFAMFEIGRAHV